VAGRICSLFALSARGQQARRFRPPPLRPRQLRPVPERARSPALDTHRTSVRRGGFRNTGLPKACWASSSTLQNAVPEQHYLDWSSSEVRSTGGTHELRVSIDGEPDELWLRAFWGEVKTFDGRWGRLELLGQTVEVRGILEDVDTEALRTELDAIVERTNALAEEMLSEDLAAAARWQEQHEESERQAGEMTDAFHTGGDE
jgi:hypothetical protein